MMSGNYKTFFVFVKQAWVCGKPEYPRAGVSNSQRYVVMYRNFPSFR